MSPPSFDASRSQEGEVAREDSGMPDGYKFFVYVEDNWWEKNIHLMRYIGFVMAVVFSILYGFLRGAVYGLTSFVLTLIYLNVPHQFAYATLSITFGLLNIVRSCHWLHRHRDAVYPFLALLAPYQVILIYSFYYFRHHFLTCLVLVPVNALLISRTIDLVREFDVTARGCVRWYDENHNILPPSLSTLLEDSYEKKHEHVDVVSLDLAIDLKNKQIRYADGRIVQLRRVQVIPYGNSKYYLYSRAFYAYAVPKLLSMQSPGYLSGARFRTARVVLRGITFTFLVVFAIIVSGMILQAAFPFSRPLPVRVEVPEDYSKLTLDHIVVHLDLFSSDYVEPKNSSSTEDLVSRWFGNKRTNHWDTVEPGDLYPHLCTREYHGTSVFEISLLSAAPYLFNREEVETLLRFMNRHLGSDWSLRPRHGAACKYGDSNHAPTGWAGFYDIYSKSRDLSVIAIRGTDLSSFTDFLIDVNMFFETVLYQVLTSVIPGAAIIPPDLVSDMIRLVSIPPSDSVYDLSTAYYANPTPKRYKEDPRRETWAQLTQSRNESLRFCRQNNYHRDFFADVYNHVVYIGSQRDHPGHVLITGHSLGGAVAAVLASQLEVPAVLFSAPGIVLSRKKFNVELRALQKYVLTIVQSNDIVPMMGSHGGEVQHMECLAQTKELCHAMEFIIGSLWRSCESIRNKYPSLKKVL
ncbi:Lipase (class 3), putative [Angomonas deanei]|uniref:Lipase (Class 3), putative n=1 Tax=Angomonas deanei TaxID=59799 RepID=A0A7G2C9Q3_9TRYP|nr:Lipase (class 3), putative [Angomonas deanei]